MRGKPLSPTGPNSAAPKNRRDSGFTLIEMIAVMAIVALVLSVALPKQTGTTSAELKSLAMRIVAQVKNTRRLALAGRDGTVLHFDAAAQRSFALPADVKLIPRLWGTCAQSATLVFSNFGTSCGGFISLTNRSASVAIEINGITGDVEVVDAQP